MHCSRPVKLHTVKFYETRDFLTENGHIFNEDQLEHIKLFQEHRNKLVHLHLELAPGDLFDLKFQVIYVIVHIIIPSLAEINPSYETPSEFHQEELDKEDYLQLVEFPPYVKEMEDLATDHSSHVYYCPECSEKTFSVDQEICYAAILTTSARQALPTARPARLKGRSPMTSLYLPERPHRAGPVSELRRKTGSITMPGMRKHRSLS